MARTVRVRDETGQSTVEWTALILLVALAMAFLGAIAGMSLPGAALAHAVASKIVCATGLTGECGGASSLAISYGEEIAQEIEEHVPDLLYEESMREIPVDYRECREDGCSIASGTEGAVSETVGGLPATAFVHTVDCRAERIALTEEEGFDCSGERTGRLYLQYWLYYPDSQTDPFGENGYHEDDWESFQVRIGDEGIEARASSHHSYNYEGGVQNWVSDSGVITKSAWGPFVPTYYVSAGSHAGHVADDDETPTFTPGSELVLIPIESIGATGTDDDIFAVIPPWLKAVYEDPEDEGT